MVFVLDASRSMQRRGGLAAQLAIVAAYAHDVPGAQVELVLAQRTAERVLGRLVPVADLEKAMAPVADVPLENGSFLDRGAALAADVLQSEHTPGRIVLMTDGELRSSFDPRAAVAALKRAPAGTVVHLLYPAATKGSGIGHRVPEGLDAVPRAMGGSSYDVSVDPNDATNGVLSAWLGRVVSPDRLESVELRGVDTARVWPDLSDGAASASEILAGQSLTWGGISKQRPTGPLSFVGWIWGQKQEIRPEPDPAFERMLPRIATREVATELGCVDANLHRDRALRDAFLAQLEVQDNELLNVSVAGKAEDGQRCAEEALWGMALPDRADGPVSARADYKFGLARRQGQGAAP